MSAAPLVTTTATLTPGQIDGDMLVREAFICFGVGPHTVGPYLSIDRPETIHGYRFLCDALQMAYQRGFDAAQKDD